jgi:hypothetical protein
MSELMISASVPGIKLSTDQQSNPAMPQWFAEVLLLGEYWRTTGLLERLQTQVKVHRGRMGHYEVCDFVLVLFAYAVSGLDTLEDFFEQLNCVKSVLMSVWQRQHCPVASTLSRFLGDIEPTALEQLRTLFESDLMTHGFDSTHNGGLVDRSGEHFWVFDVDGTHQVVRQRTLVSNASYPNPRRRSRAANAKGYMGRRRGEATRTRSAVAQSHTSEWLGTFGAPGNGTPGPDLSRACGIIQDYLQHHKIEGKQAIVRLDGFYGAPQFVNLIQEHQLGYLLRSRDYSLLQHQAVQACLQATSAGLWTHPEAHQVREVFDLGFVEDSWAGYCQPIRLIVVRTPHNPNRKHSVGKRLGDFIYELFVTSHLQTGLTGCDLLSLYYGRGGFEKCFGDEDVEQTCDRWCSWHPSGQEFWQILNQWVWNWRLWAGFAHHPQPVRKTLWVPVVAASEPVAPSPATIHAPLALSKANPPCPPADSKEFGPMQVAGSWARSLGKFSGADFKLLNERTLQCPAGHAMYRREKRLNRLGDLLVLFGINPQTCQACPLKSKCLADGSKGTGGRRITVVRKKLAASDSEPETHASTEAVQPVQPEPVQPVAPVPPTTQSVSPLSQPVIWLDFAMTRLRRELSHQLRKQQIVIESIATNLPTSHPDPEPEFITRDQRAHRRLSWTQRWARNANVGAVTQWQVKLFGISSAVLDWLHSLKPSPGLIM